MKAVDKKELINIINELVSTNCCSCPTGPGTPDCITCPVKENKRKALNIIKNIVD